MLPSKFLSHWYGAYLYLWMFLYVCKVRGILSINPLYIVICYLYGFLVIESYHLLTATNSNISFSACKLVMHVVPYLLLFYIVKEDLSLHPKSAFITLILATLPYLIYMYNSNQSIHETYFSDTYPRTWDDLRTLCKDKDYVTCYIYRRLQN